MLKDVFIYLSFILPASEIKKGELVDGSPF